MKQNLESIANNIKLFGHLFSNVHIRRKNSTTGEKQDIYVPITYVGKERMFYLINKEQTSLTGRKIEAVYPKMGYVLTDIFPDWDRMTNPYTIISGKKYDSTTGEEIVESQLNKIPVTFKFTLTIATIHQSDLYHILEQIFPQFKPSFTLKAMLNPDLGETKSDVNIVLKSGSLTDMNEETPFGDNPEKPFVYSLEFEQKSWIWATNDEDEGGSSPFGKPIREIELGVFVQKEPLTEEQIKSDASYTIHYPEHIGSN